MAVGKLGKLAPHPEHTHPRVKLSNHFRLASLPPVPAIVDYASKVPQWPVYMNYQIGDCTCAAIAHSIQAWTAYAKGLVTLPNSAVLALYEAMGYIPGNPATDRGAVEQDVLAKVQEVGIGGHKILAYAQVNHKDPDEMKLALHLFGSLYLGAQMPQSALDQTDAHQPWTYVPGSQIAGGHAFVAQRWDTTAAPMSVVTWGQLQRVDMQWWECFGEEAWVIITQDWLTANGTAGNGVDITQLGDEFSILTGKPNPFRTTVRHKPWYCIGLTEMVASLFAQGKHSR